MGMLRLHNRASADTVKVTATAHGTIVQIDMTDDKERTTTLILYPFTAVTNPECAEIIKAITEAGSYQSTAFQGRTYDNSHDAHMDMGLP